MFSESEGQNIFYEWRERVWVKDAPTQAVYGSTTSAHNRTHLVREVHHSSDAAGELVTLRTQAPNIVR